MRHVPAWVRIVGQAIVVTFLVAGCKTDASQVLGDETGIEPGAGSHGDIITPATNFIAKLDASCGTGSCHRAAGTGMLPFAVLQRYADQTAGIQSCMELHKCYDEGIDKDQATQCWTACVVGSGGLTGNGGIFQAAIRNGIIKRLMDTAGIDEADTEGMLRMPMSPPPAARDIARDIDQFRGMANWMLAEVSSDYAGISAVRPDEFGGDNGQEVVCDEFPPAVTNQIIRDYSQDGLKMLGCPGVGWPDKPEVCLSKFPISPFADKKTPGLVVRVLRRLTNRPPSAYWMRTSPDGRYASVGNGFIEDLKVDDRKISVNPESIDPAFSPDNKFYLWPAMICPIAPLANTALTEVGPQVPASGCVEQDIGVYASMGTDINGDILLVQGYLNNNFGGGGIQRDSSQMPDETGSFQIRRISNNHVSEDVQEFITPYETDYQIAPSSKLIVGRFLRKGGTQAYRVRVVRPDGKTINPTDIAASGAICMKGEKANISYDNRFITFHHYSDGSPQDEGTEAGAGNIFVYDLLKRRGIRVTNMTGGNGAYFPHFRADGWLMFQIKGADGVESIAASNAALLMRNMP